MAVITGQEIRVNSIVQLGYGILASIEPYARAGAFVPYIRPGDTSYDNRTYRVEEVEEACGIPHAKILFAGQLTWFPFKDLVVL